jgi:hypothetical protein
VQALAAGCVGAGFCIVNGGDPASWVSSFLVAALIFAMRRRLTALNFNVHITFFVVAFGGSLLAGLLARLTQTATPAIALLAPCLFLVPGVPMINGGVDICSQSRDHGHCQGWFHAGSPSCAEPRSRTHSASVSLAHQPALRAAWRVGGRPGFGRRSARCRSACLS